MPGRGILRTGVLLVLGAVLCAPGVAQDTAVETAAAPAEQPQFATEVYEVRVVGRGSTWIALEWDSTGLKHDVLYGPMPRYAKKAPKLYPLRNVGLSSYSVINLLPNTRYEFRVRAYPRKEGVGKIALSEPIEDKTLEDGPRQFSGLLFWPQKRMLTLPREVTEACIEAHRGKLYVLETAVCDMSLSRVDPNTFEVEWTRPLAAQIDEEPLCVLSPDTCILEDKLWITWHVQEGIPDEQGRQRYRQRLMYCDLSGDAAERGGGPEGLRVSAPLEIVPRSPNRSTESGSLTAYLDSLWISWVESWTEPDGETRAMLMLAPYEAWRGQVGRAVPWWSCPTRCIHAPSVAAFGGNLAILFGDGTPGADSQPLRFAQFDGKRIYDVRVVRRLGRNTFPRGVQLYDRLYFVYQSDARYLSAGGVFCDIALGKLAPGVRSGGGQRAHVSALPYVADMKYNRRPDVAMLNGDLYVVAGKHDHIPLEPGKPETIEDRGFGTYIGKVTRLVGEGLDDL